MLKSSLLLLLLLAGTTAFLAGAWTGPATYGPELADSSFSPQAITLDSDVLDTEVMPTRLVDKAIAKLTHTTWLKTAIRQSMIAPESSFVADGVLHLGPDHCARLELKVQTAGVASNLLIVSDGGVTAEERTIGSDTPAIVCERFPEAGKAQHLAGKCCGGPLTILRELRSSLRNLKLQTGVLDGFPVIQLHGDLDAAAGPMRQCSVFLDATTLWPHRVEWRCASSQRVMRIEFRDPEVNRQLSVEECERVFSYQPK